jgi:hypothetical protein
MWRSLLATVEDKTTYSKQFVSGVEMVDDSL